jgi:uncharacterized membrane protein
MKSNVAIRGHPVHPQLVPIPIGLIVWTFVADIVFVLSDDQTWYDIALWSGLAAWIAALVAALPGFIDYLNLAVHSDSRNIATAHMLLNLGVVAVYAIASVLMWDEGATSGSQLTLVVILHAAGNGLVAASGWLGGEMVYRRHLSIIPDNVDLEIAERERHLEMGTQRGRPRA